jgi:hypothetical protein
MLPPRALLLLAAIAITLAIPRSARACAVCGAGDPTLTVAGTETPYAGRLRLSGDLRAGGARVRALDLHEQRLDVAIAYAPLPAMFLTLSVPVLHRSVAEIDRRAASDAWTPGDVDARVKGFVLRRREGALTHDLALLGGVRLPSALVQKGAHGEPLPAALQPGGSAVTPLAGASYDLRRGPWMLYTSATFFVPFAVRAGAHACDVLRASVTAQAQPHPRVATRVGFDARLESSAAGDTKSDPDAGGFLGYLSPEIVVSPTADLLLTAGARFPVIQALRGDHREHAIVSIGVAYDLR